jgi:hypothetical protein
MANRPQLPERQAIHHRPQRRQLHRMSKGTGAFVPSRLEYRDGEEVRTRELSRPRNPAQPHEPPTVASRRIVSGVDPRTPPLWPYGDQRCALAYTNPPHCLLQPGFLARSTPPGTHCAAAAAAAFRASTLPVLSPDTPPPVHRT